MKKKDNIEYLKKDFQFLISDYKYSIKEIKISTYDLYAKFISINVGIYFIYEFRDIIPRIQISLLSNGNFEIRPGYYTIKELYSDKNYILKSF